MRIFQIALGALIAIHGVFAVAANRCDVVFQREALLSPNGTVRVLFGNNQEPVRNYAEVLFATKPGDTLRFGKGEEFLIQKILGFGMTTYILDIGGGWVLRVPLYNGRQYNDFGGDTQGVALLNDYLNSYPAMKAAGLPVVEVDLGRSRQNKYAVVEKVDVKFTLNELNEQNLTREEKLVLRKKLIHFAAKFWPVDHVGDFGGRQIAYDGKDWVLLDYGFTNHYISDFSSKENIFQPYSTEGYFGGTERVTIVDPVTEKEISQVIAEKRHVAKKAGWKTRPEGGNEDPDVGFLVTFPYKDHLKNGTLLEAHRKSNYNNEREAPSKGPSRFLQIREHLKDKKEFSLYEVDLGIHKRGFLVLKNSFDKKIKPLNPEDLRELFSKRIPPDSQVQAFGFDYVLFKK